MHLIRQHTSRSLLDNMCASSATGVLLDRPEVVDLAVMTSRWLSYTLPAIVGSDSAGVSLNSTAHAALVKQVTRLLHCNADVD